MRLLRLDIKEFRSIENEWIPADGLVVLFGPNSAGKTSVLEAAEHLITEAATFRLDPADGYELSVVGSVTFDLPGANAAGSVDAHLYWSLLRGDYAKEDIFGSTENLWGWLDDGLAGQLKNLDVAGVTSRLANALVNSGAAGTGEDRALLARSIFNPDADFLTADGLGIELAVYGPALPGEAMDAARRMADIADTGDPLWKIAADLVSHGVAHISQVAGGAGHWESFAKAFPPVIVLDGDSGSLSAELQEAVSAVHDRLWWIQPKVISTTPFLAVLDDNFTIGTAGVGDRYDQDGWLEGHSDEGDPVIREPLGSAKAGDWYRARHSVLAAAKLIELEANNVAPGFVAEQGTIGIEILPVSVWGGGLPRIRATFTEYGEEARDLRVVGAGTARWVAAAVRLACRRLAAGRQIVTDDSGMAVSDDAEKRRIVGQARQAPLTQCTVRLEPSDAAAVYIADEPEAHLHPAALQSVRQWLTRLATSAATVLVATHSAALLDSTSNQVHRVLVTRKRNRTHLRRMTGALDSELGRVADDLGLSRGELLLMTRLALFVEGPHDQIILEEWFGDELRAAGIRVFPIAGIDNLPGLGESEITAALGIRIGALSDNTSVARASLGSPRTKEEEAVSRFLAEAARSGIQVHAIGLEAPDILYYLDEEICRRTAPSFPGWSAAVADRNNAGSHAPWKRWIEKKYSLPLKRENVRRLARICHQEDKIPAELTRKIQELAAYAAAGSRNHRPSQPPSTGSMTPDT
jgi:energy-coupling factor transporter ATP-binding protein EcfA2